MPDQFERTRLLLGKEAMERLAHSRVAVFGLGGVGGHTAEALARSGVGALDLIDGDVVSFTNCNRQIIATLATVGQPKVQAMRERILEINPAANIRIFPLFFGPETDTLPDFQEYDYVADAIDSVTGKIEIILRAKAAGRPVISAMGAGNKLDPTRFEVADLSRTSVCPLARVMRRELRARGIEHVKVVYSKEEPRCPIGAGDGAEQSRPVPGSTAYVPAVAGLIMAGEIVKDLVENRGIL